MLERFLYIHYDKYVVCIYGKIKELISATIGRGIGQKVWHWILCNLSHTWSKENVVKTCVLKTTLSAILISKIGMLAGGSLCFVLGCISRFDFSCLPAETMLTVQEPPGGHENSSYLTSKRHIRFDSYPIKCATSSLIMKECLKWITSTTAYDKSRN